MPKDELKTGEEAPITDPLQTAKTPEAGKETVIVNAETLKQLLDAHKELQERLRRVESVADRGRLQNYDASQPQAPIKRIIRLNTLDGKVIVGWSKLKVDEIIRNASGIPVAEKQVRELFFSDGSTVTIEYLRSVQDITKVDAEIQATLQTDTGTVFKVLNLADGKEYEVDARFVN